MPLQAELLKGLRVCVMGRGGGRQACTIGYQKWAYMCMGECQYMKYMALSTPRLTVKCEDRECEFPESMW